MPQITGNILTPVGKPKIRRYDCRRSADIYDALAEAVKLANVTGNIILFLFNVNFVRVYPGETLDEAIAKWKIGASQLDKPSSMC